MNPCEPHEIALERRAAGDLPEDEARALEAHLAGCPACADHARRLERMETMIADTNATVDPRRSWSRVNAYVIRREEKMHRAMRRNLPIALVSGTLVLVLSLATGRYSLTFFALGGVLTVLLQIVVQLQRQRSFRAIAESPADVLTVARRELVMRRLLVRSGAFLCAVLATLWIGTGLESPPSWLPTLGYDAGGPFCFGMGAIFVAYAVYLLAVDLPRLRRELAEYEE